VKDVEAPRRIFVVERRAEDVVLIHVSRCHRLGVAEAANAGGNRNPGATVGEVARLYVEKVIYFLVIGDRRIGDLRVQTGAEKILAETTGEVPNTAEVALEWEKFPTVGISLIV
jgi:hypothetical protein